MRHILYLGGAGRRSPYHSTSESQEVARYFAGESGWVYSTTVPQVAKRSVGHIGRAQLLDLLKGRGKGRARWKSALEVMQARKYVEQWAEHLIDFTGQQDLDRGALRELLAQLYGTDR